ncbi:DNA repair protein [Photobacterium angustum]|uniref:AAA family ATPase n=1 Tax=Photobacterium angustum TaxID=661 RepID=UPI0005DD5E1B|nr:AAA family ATPase [Photobacterium angustum]KJG06650.1 DNA repair protein [Photobacterium angustum]PSV91667.1 DNA repair protein [Photobacterium angustum]
MKIKKVEIEAFRAYQSKLDGTFDFTNDRGEPVNFVAIYAPNGFGKSSFYDAVEWAITNRVKRLTNYQNEAKSIKNRDEGLKILRNKYVNEKTVTNVVVSTSFQHSFERYLPKIRKNQSDMSIGNLENEFFQKIILSQDAIEGFLREEKPQERYSKFMESFGGNIETARKELSILINDNNSEVSALEKKRKSLLLELEQPIDFSIFEQFNSVASELNSLGECIILPEESISSESVHHLNASLILRQHELNESLNAKNELLVILDEHLRKLPEIELHVGYQIEQKKHLDRVLKGIADVEKYKGLLASHNKCVEDKKQTSVRLNHLIEIAEKVEDFFQIESRLKDIAKSKSLLTDDCSKITSDLAGFEQKLIQLNNELKVDDDRVILLRNTVDNSKLVYDELSNNRERIVYLNQQLSDRKTVIHVEKGKRDELNHKLNELSSLKITSNLLLAGSVGNFVFEKEKIEQLGKFNVELDLLEVNIQALNSTQKALAEQMEIHERLISIGLDYLSVEPSNVCPLCTVPHPSSEELIGKVKGQNLLSGLSQENAEKISQSSIRQKKLRDKIQSITLQAVDSQAQQLNNLREKLYEVEKTLSKAEQENNTFESEKKNLEDRISELEQAVWGLPNQDLETRIGSELNQLSDKRLSLIQQKEKLVEQIQVATELLKADRIEYSRLESEMETKSNSNVYVTVLAYLNENSIAVQDIKKHLKLKKEELEAVIRRCIALDEAMTSQCSDILQEMIANGTYTDIVILKKEKETLELALTNSKSIVDEFYMSLSSYINILSDDTLEQLKELITFKIDDCQVYAHKLEKLLSGIKLLLELMNSFKPYIKRLSIEEELHTLEQQLEKRNQVDAVLVKEREVIIEKLGALINNFFYEDLINAIYKKIDPHPTFKKVEFKVSFETEKPTLNILVSDGAGGILSPILYFSAAQTNILSLSVFLANAIHAKDDNEKPIDVILIDDPIQAMDSINVLSTIDLLRSICVKFNKQLIISTHDENFFGLLQRKIPTEIFGSKFLQLKTFGVVASVEPIIN